MAESIRTWFDDPDNQTMLSKLKADGLNMEIQSTATGENRP